MTQESNHSVPQPDSGADSTIVSKILTAIPQSVQSANNQQIGPIVLLLPIKRPNTYRKNGLRMRFSAQNTAFIDINIYICTLKCKLYLHENNDIYDKGFQKSPYFYYD